MVSVPLRDPLPDEAAQRRRLLILNEWVILATISISSVLSLSLRPSAWQVLATGFLVYGLSTGAALWVAHRGYVRAALVGHTVQVFACNTVALTLMRELPAHMLLAMVNFVLLHAVVLGRRAALGTTLVMTALLVAGLQVGELFAVELSAVRGPSGEALGIDRGTELISLITTTLSTGFIVVTTLDTLQRAERAAVAATRQLSAAKAELQHRHERARLLSELGAAAAAALSPDEVRQASLSTLTLGLNTTPERHSPHPDEGDPDPRHVIVLEHAPKPVQVRCPVPLDADEQRFGETVARIHQDAVARMVADERLREAERLEGVGRLAASVAHDLNNLLLPVTAAADLIAADANHGARFRREVKSIQAVTVRATALVEKLLTHARSREPVLRPVSVGGVVRRSEALLKSFLQGRTRLELSVATQHTTVLADPIEVEQVLLNLFLNARDAVGADGTIWVTVDGQGHEVLLSVADDGPGVPSELREWIFEPFHSTRTEGSGLGLSTVGRIVASIGGEVQVEARDGGGARFEVALPACAEVAVADALDAPDGPAPAPMRILVVEDDPDVRLALQAMLEALGHATEAAEDGQAALEVLAADPGVALVVTDFQMPRLTGAELIRTMRQRGDHRPVVLLSGYGPDIHGGPAAGSVVILAKPIRLVTLQAALRQALACAGAAPGLPEREPATDPRPRPGDGSLGPG